MQATAEVCMSEFALDVRAGLGAEGQKTLPCRYFYDEVGSALFQVITRLPEYGLTRADDRIIRKRAEELAMRMEGPVLTVELGSGDGTKTRRILKALLRHGRPVYFPVDVSRTALDACRRLLAGVAEVAPLEASYLEGLQHAASLRRPGQRLFVLFLGSTIGNFSREEARQFLAQVRKILKPGDAFLLGTDLVKPKPQLLAAYDDPAGVTAAFNLNLLARINRELGGTFDLRRFRHEAVYNHAERRIEMHLRSIARQTVRVRDAAMLVEFDDGETIWTESSLKFRLDEVAALAAGGGFECVAQWADAEWPFAENLLIADGAGADGG